MLSTVLQRLWWISLLRGILAILFGILVLARPGIALVSLILVFGVFLVLEGVFAIIHSLQGRREMPNWWVMLLEGALALLLGVYALRTPGLASLALLYFIGAWAVVSGLARIIFAISLRKEIQGEWWLVLGGTASVLFGLIMFARPGAGALALLWLVGIWSILAGIAFAMLAFKARRFGNAITAAKAQVAGS